MSTWYENNGTVKTEKQITEEQMWKILEYFNLRHNDDAGFMIQFNEIEFECFTGDIQHALEETVAYLDVVGNPVTDIDISYIGDYDGGYRLRDGRVIAMNIEDLAFEDSTPEELMEKAAEKGGYIYRVHMFNDEVDHLVCNATSEEKAKELTREFLSEFAPGEEEETMNNYRFHLRKEALNVTGCNDNFRLEERELSIRGWLGSGEGLTLKRVCPMCQAWSFIRVNGDAYRKYRSGALIQYAFPEDEYNPMERELIKTGYCPDCQKLLFRSNYTSSRVRVEKSEKHMRINQLISTDWIRKYAASNSSAIAEIIDEMLKDFESSKEKTHAYVLKNYNDELVYGEEYIKVFPTRQEALEKMRELLENHYGCPYADIPEKLSPTADYLEDFVCDGPLGGPYEYWMVTEEEVQQ